MTSLAWAATAFDAERERRYDTYDRYYRGDHDLEYATPKFKSAFGRTFEAFSYNRCANVVEALVDRMQVTGFDAPTEALRTRARELWDGEHMAVHEDRVYREAFTAGDGYVIVEHDPRTDDIHIWPQDASDIRVLYDPNVPGKRVAAVKRWPLDDGRVRLNLYLPGVVYKFVSVGPVSGVALSEQAALSIAARYEPYREERVPWPLKLRVPDEVPVFHFANNAAVNEYGRSELCDVIPIQNALNKTLMDLLVAMEFAAFPQRVIVDVDTSNPANDEAIKTFVAGITQILALYSEPDGKTPSLHEFSATNIQQYTAVVELFDQLISRASKVPTHYLTLPTSPPSGEALKVAEAPFTAKIESRQRAFGAVWGEVVRYALRLKGASVPAGVIRPVYASAMPVAIEERLAHAKSAREIGLPLVTVLRREFGLDPTEIAQIKAEIDEEAGSVAPFPTRDEQERAA